MLCRIKPTRRDKYIISIEMWKIRKWNIFKIIENERASRWLNIRSPYSENSIDTTCMYTSACVYKVSWKLWHECMEDDSAKPRLRFPVRDGFRLYVYRYAVGLVHFALDTRTVRNSARSKKENTSRAYQKNWEKAESDTFTKKKIGGTTERGTRFVFI